MNALIMAMHNIDQIENKERKKRRFQFRSHHFDHHLRILSTFLHGKDCDKDEGILFLAPLLGMAME